MRDPSLVLIFASMVLKHGTLRTFRQCTSGAVLSDPQNRTLQVKIRTLG